MSSIKLKFACIRCYRQCLYLVLWRIVELGVVALAVSVVQEVVVHQVPAPALGVGAEERHVAVTLGRRLLGRDPYHRHRAEGALPDHLVLGKNVINEEEEDM